MVKSGNYGFPLSLLLHLIIFAIPVSIGISKHFKKVELFIIDERPVQPVKEKPTTPKEMPKEIKRQLQPYPFIKEPEFKEIPKLTEIPSSKDIIEPVIISKTDNPPLTLEPTVSPVVSSATSVLEDTPKPLIDVEFGSPNAPAFLHREMPVYPLIARRLGKEGRILLRLTIDEKGKLLNIEVIEGAAYGFTEAAIEAVKKSTFKPAMQDGKPVMSKALLPIRFSLRRD